MDILTWLRKEAEAWPYLGAGLVKAADEIERLRQELEDERAAHNVCIEMRNAAETELTERMAGKDGRVIAHGSRGM